MVTHRNDRDPEPVFLNWKPVLTGIVRETPDPTLTVSARPPRLLQISPSPSMKNQISDTVLCLMALETQPSGRVQ
jgi:hypothetical protein